MSFIGDVIFNVYFGGYWLKNHDGELGYIDGEVKEIVCQANDFFIELGNELGEDYFAHRMWYKMPFEDNNERKSLSNGSLSSKKMCVAAEWTRQVDIFLVDSANYPEDVVVDEPCEEELRVERNVACFIDEDVDFDYHNTPPNSDGEEEEENYVRCKKGSGEFKLNQVFDSLEDFKEALIDYVLKEGWNIMQNRWGKHHSGAKCGIGDACPWHIYCSYEEPIGKWMVKTYEDEHNCMKDGYSKILKAGVIAKLLLDDIRTDPEIKPRMIQEQIQKRFNLMTTIDRCKKAKAKALEIVNREHVEQFSRLVDYQKELIRSNPGSTVVLDTLTDDAGSVIFHRFYVCFEKLKSLWSTWCRPIFGVDGCFLKSTLKGQLLAAVGRDANNQMYPFAWAIVDVENEDNWTWFLQKLKGDVINLRNGNGYTIISDRQKGLLNAVERELSEVEHRMCARHIYGNLKKMFPYQSEMKRMFWRVAESYTLSEYEENLEMIKSYDMRIYEAIMQKNPKNCSLAFCKPTASCVDVHNNISESFNNAIDPARYIPLVEMLETIRRRSMIRIDLRKKAARDHSGRFTIKATERVELEQKKIKYCRMISGSEGRCEVLESGKAFSVNMILRTCACRKWDLSGLPCRHALRAIAEKKLNKEDFISNWYLTTRQQLIYSDSIHPVNGMQFWQKSGPTILPPPSLVESIENRKGRKPKPKRKKGKHESPQKKKATRERRIIHCGKCSFAGHNSRKCNNNGVGVYRRPKKKSSNTREDDYESNNTAEDGYESNNTTQSEGPSQPTQTSLF